MTRPTTCHVALMLYTTPSMPEYLRRFLFVMLKSGEVKTWKSTVLIERCRYLEATQCKGICSSVCKVSPIDHVSPSLLASSAADRSRFSFSSAHQVPTQEFFGGYLGMPVTMTPNFEDLSCEMK